MKITFATDIELKDKTIIKSSWNLHVSGDADDEIYLETDELLDAIAGKLRTTSVT